ncbi:MAG: serine aminopeptidase domain-containing protein [Bacillota bacterium]
MAKGMINTIDYIFNNASKIDIPLLLMHSSVDRITYHQGSEEIATRVSSECTLKIWDSLYHELHNEPEKDQVFSCLLDCLNKHQQN